MTFVDFAAAQLRKLAEAANQDEPGVWYSDPNMLAMRTSIPCVDADFICACTPTRIIALLDALAHASPTPAPKVGDGFVPVPRELVDAIRDAAYDESGYTINADMAEMYDNYLREADPAPVVAEVRIPTIAEMRGILKADTAPERDPRNDPKVGDVCTMTDAFGGDHEWVITSRESDLVGYVHNGDFSNNVRLADWAKDHSGRAKFWTAAQYAAEKEKGE